MQHWKQHVGRSHSSDRSVVTLKQRGGSPFGREMDDERREGRRQHAPSDPEATSSDDEDGSIVEHGGGIRDAAAGEVDVDDELRRSRDSPNPHSPLVAQRQRSTVGTATTTQVRSVVTKPVQLRLTGGRGRAASGNGVLRLCRPGREANNSTLPVSEPLMTIFFLLSVYQIRGNPLLNLIRLPVSNL